MGANGNAFFCKKGHLYHWIEDDLYWDDNLFEEARRIKEEGCLCGNKEILVINHYGSINDCVCLESEVSVKGIEATGKSDTVIVPIKDACNKEGEPIEAYSKIKLDIYRIPQDVWSGKAFEVPDTKT